MHLSRFLLPSLAAVTLGFGLAAAAQSAPGVPNFHAVNDLVFRGGEPNAQGWQSLAQMGVKTVIDLCDEHSTAAERQAVEAAGMTYVSIPMSGDGIGIPSAAKISQALALLNQATGKIFVHCHKGSDRTGTVIACYRIEHDHWAAKQAMAEAKQFGMSMFNIGMKRYISDYARNLPAITAAAAPVVN